MWLKEEQRPLENGWACWRWRAATSFDSNVRLSCQQMIATPCGGLWDDGGNRNQKAVNQSRITNLWLWVNASKTDGWKGRRAGGLVAWNELKTTNQVCDLFSTPTVRNFPQKKVYKLISQTNGPPKFRKRKWKTEPKWTETVAKSSVANLQLRSLGKLQSNIFPQVFE